MAHRFQRFGRTGVCDLLMLSVFRVVGKDQRPPRVSLPASVVKLDQTFVQKCVCLFYLIARTNIADATPEGCRIPLRGSAGYHETLATVVQKCYLSEYQR